MINQEYFRTRLSEDVASKAKEGSDQPTMEIHLTDGTFYRVSTVIHTDATWIVLEVYPKTLKKHSAEDRRPGPHPTNLIA